MKYILIAGAKESGKSTTIENVCKQIKPSRVWELDKDEKVFIETAITTVIVNGTYIIEINGKIILVVAGSPTEQEITITILINIAISQGFNITIILVAMRLFEKMNGYDTPKELDHFAEEIDRIRIDKIIGDYKNSPEWCNRIERIIAKIKANI